MFLGNWGGTKVALKIVRDEEQYQEFVKEAKVLSQLRHPRMFHSFLFKLTC